MGVIDRSDGPSGPLDRLGLALREQGPELADVSAGRIVLQKSTDGTGVEVRGESLTETPSGGSPRASDVKGVRGPSTPDPARFG